MDNKYDVTDLVVSAIEQKPSDFEGAFNDLIVDRLRTAVEDKKVEIAKQMYGYESEEELEDEPEESEESDDAETEDNEEEIPEEEIDGQESQ